jgi:hypothetical protein
MMTKKRKRAVLLKIIIGGVLACLVVIAFFWITLFLGTDRPFICTGVKDFYNEYVVNVIRLYTQRADKLPKKSVQKSPVVEVYAPTEIPDDELLLHK